ncbi:MAG: hypothetical protein JST75_20825 [Bacteroidetes bacterium]|nr:hypothetical protein [Bacteroidota bacterium]
MKKSFLSGLTALLFLATIPCACHKTINSEAEMQTQSNGSDTTHPIQQPPNSQSTQTVPFPETGVTGCAYAPDYGDSIIFPQPTANDYIVSSINNPGSGKYFSWPAGMVIDSLTGAINVTKSETGLRYAIGFVKNGTTDTCMQNLIIGGAAYMDSVYVLADNQTTSSPYFDANPFQAPVCDGSNVSGSGCQFDITNDAKNKKIIVDKNTGVIDLKKTLDGTLLGLGGAFGLIPADGQIVETTIYYRLNDASNNALQHITVQLMYFNSKSSINTGLVNSLLLKVNNVLTGNLISKTTNPRPPLIIITRFN